MKTDQIKLFVIAITFLTLAVVVFNTSLTSAVPINKDDAAATYKTKCAACHTQKAEKFFDAAKADEQHVEIILKGKKGAKPPFMPGYEAGGMTREQAQALTVYMRQLRSPGKANTNTNANANMNTKVNANVNAKDNANVKANANVNTNAVANVNVNSGKNINANSNTGTNANVSDNSDINANLSKVIAQLYKTKCAACHTAKAEKFFDLAKADEQHIEIILKGKKGKTPPFMPAFDGKGVTNEQAKALTGYMRTLRAAGNK